MINDLEKKQKAINKSRTDTREISLMGRAIKTDHTTTTSKKLKRNQEKTLKAQNDQPSNNENNNGERLWQKIRSENDPQKQPKAEQGIVEK